MRVSELEDPGCARYGGRFTYAAPPTRFFSGRLPGAGGRILQLSQCEAPGGVCCGLSGAFGAAGWTQSLSVHLKLVPGDWLAESDLQRQRRERPGECMGRRHAVAF